MVEIKAYFVVAALKICLRWIFLWLFGCHVWQGITRGGAWIIWINNNIWLFVAILKRYRVKETAKQRILVIYRFSAVFQFYWHRANGAWDSLAFLRTFKCVFGPVFKINGKVNCYRNHSNMSTDFTSLEQ